MRRNFSETSDIQRFFPPQIRWSPKKKKKKKKKKVFANFETDCSALLGNPNVCGGLFSYGGGAIFNFSLKIDLKTTKKVRFCILYKPMGGLEPPPLATLLAAINKQQATFRICLLKNFPIMHKQCENPLGSSSSSFFIARFSVRVAGAVAQD